MIQINELIDVGNVPNTPMSLDEYNKAIDTARQQIKDGDYLSVKALETISIKW